jgi:hypothetical protein
VTTPVFPRQPCTSDSSYPMCNGSCSGSAADCSYPTVLCDSSGVGCFEDTPMKQQYALNARTCKAGTCAAIAPWYCGAYKCHSNFCLNPPCSSFSCWGGTCPGDSNCNTADGYHCDPSAKICM